MVDKACEFAATSFMSAFVRVINGGAAPSPAGARRVSRSMSAGRPSSHGLPAPWLEPTQESLEPELPQSTTLRSFTFTSPSLGGEARCPVVRLRDAADAAAALS